MPNTLSIYIFLYLPLHAKDIARHHHNHLVEVIIDNYRLWQGYAAPRGRYWSSVVNQLFCTQCVQWHCLTDYWNLNIFREQKITSIINIRFVNWCYVNTNNNLRYFFTIILSHTFFFMYSKQTSKLLP